MLSKGKMKKKIIVTGLVVTVIHLVLALGSVFVATSAGMERFDNPDYQFTVTERLADRVAGVLIQPGMSLWNPWMSKNMPNIVEWMLYIANSLLWGFAISLAVNARTILTKS